MEHIRNLVRETLSEAWYTLYRYTYEYLRSDGQWDKQQREAYDRGNGAAALLYDPVRQRVVLTRQFRLPTYINGNQDGFLTEVCAGLLDGDAPEACMKREILEETGYAVTSVVKVAEVYTSPGAVTEKLYLYQAQYSPEMKRESGGGVAEESEDIQILEWSYTQVFDALKKGLIRDAKTLILLQHAIVFGPLKGCVPNENG
ncbi:NUDIX domain-containing protein [Robiginitalea sp.]|uniref:NUDIX domain-containing protein n=1 Tax=Robiginitalea sp. TaxID=1902411 RepID=UPI003C73CEFC